MLGLYIHIPFFVKKCPYCGFFSTHYDTATVDRYLSAVVLDIEANVQYLTDHPVGSVYIGGGTPTTLSSDQFSLLLTMINKRVHLDVDAEITVEANPNTVTENSLSTLNRLGVTRLSIGVQSFSDRVLSILGRAHSASQAFEAVHAAREAGFRSIGIDLIFGIPGQSEIEWNNTLETAIFLVPEHISAYSLSIDEGSRWFRDEKEGKRKQPDDDADAIMYDTAIKILGSRGYHQYEISNFCLPGQECRHNVNYWDRGEYLGLGAGAWSFIGNRRWANIADVGQYLSNLKNGRTVRDHDRDESVSEEQAALEKLFLGLRKISGVDLADYGSQFGDKALDTLLSRTGDLKRDGLIDIRKGALALTSRGRLLSNEVLARIIR